MRRRKLLQRKGPAHVRAVMRRICRCTEIRDIQVAPALRSLRISVYGTDSHELAIDLHGFGQWLDPREDTPEQSPSIAGAPGRTVSCRLGFQFL